MVYEEWMALMNFNINKLFAVLVTIVIFIVISVFFIMSLIKNNAEESYNLYSSILRNQVNIYENDYGIGHISAKSDEDLFFAIGYYQAEKRLWQMDFLRRFAIGNLSEIFGKDAVDIDKFIRCFEIKDVSQRNWDSLSGKSQLIIKSFSEGINFYIEKHKNNLPVEFSLLDYEPTKWEPWQTLAISKAMTFEFSFGIWVDIVNGQIKDKLGEKYLKYFIPNFNDFKFNDNLEKDIINIDSNYINTLSKFHKNFKTFESGIGSNCWTTGVSESQDGNLILANDPHTQVSVPARWIEVHISNENINSVGLMIPGIPLPIIGRNDNIAWGITSLLIDDFDYNIEKISNDKKFYYTNDTIRHNIQYITDTIRIKGSEPYLYYQKKTDMSVILSESHISRNLGSFADGKYYQANKYFDKYALTFQWVGKEISDEILSMYKINRASNFDEFESSFSTWFSPGLSFHYIGKDNMMRIVPAGVVPIRDAEQNPLLPQISYKKRYKWSGYEKLYHNYQITDIDQSGYLISANNLFIKANNYITDYQEPDSRYMRIKEVLNLEKPNNLIRSKYLQMDQKSLYARDLLKICLKVLEGKQSLLSPLEKQAYYKLTNWNYILSSRDNTSSIYTLFFYNLLKNTYADELGNSLMAQYTFLSSISTRKLMESILNNESKIFDNINTNEIENRDYIIFISFQNAIKDCIEIFNSKDLKTWEYGKFHQISPTHILSREDDLKPIFEFGKSSIGGNNTTILNTGWNYNDGFNASVYPSVRFVCNLRDSLVYISLPGGISGDPQSINYKDQYQLWLNGGYIAIPINRIASSEFKRKVTISSSN